MTNAEAWLNIALRPRKPEGSLGRTAQDVHLDSHTAPELCMSLHFNVSDKKCVATYGRRQGVEGIRDHTCIHNSSSSHVRVNQ